MKLTKKSKYSISFKDKDNSAVFLYNAPQGKLDSSADVLFGRVESEEIFHMPGEYEFSDIAVIAAEAGEGNSGIANSFGVYIDEVNFLIPARGIEKLPKSQWDLWGEVDVMLYDMQEDLDVEKLLKRVNPHVVVVVNYDSKEQVEKKFDLTAEDELKTIKFSASDFTDENSSIRLILLKD